MGNTEFEEKAKKLVLDYYKALDEDIDLDFKIYVVWICKILGNNKALLSTNIQDSKYFEITYNGMKNEFYFDAYVKEYNAAIPNI